MNLLIVVVLAAVAWYAFESGMEFIAFIFVLGAILFLFTQKQGEEQMYVAAHGQGGQGPVIFEPPQHHGATPEWQQPGGTRGSALYDTQHIRLQIKPRWKKHWQARPQHYLFLHAGVALQNIARSFLYILGIEKDKK